MSRPGPAGRHGLHEVMTSAAAVVAGPDLGFHDTLGLPEARRYVVLLVDGMGEQLLREHAHLAPFLSSLPSVPDVVCGVPSTTVTSLTSLGTGLRAGSHGVVGYTSRVPETGRRFNALAWDQPVDAQQWQRHPTVLQRLHEAGLNAASVNESRFEGSGLTLCSQRGAPFHGVGSVWERLDVVADVVEDADRSLVYAYESRLDHAGHAHGSTSQEWRDVLVTVDRETAQLRDLLPDDTVLLVTADHGMVDLPAEVTSLVDGQSGEARFRWLHARPGAAVELLDVCTDAFGDMAWVAPVGRVVSDGWLGPLVTEAARRRLGDVALVAHQPVAFVDAAEHTSIHLIGRHGGLTDAELDVPALAVVT